MAYAALEAGGTAPAVLNAANEVAVQSFLDGRLGFDAIPGLIEDALDNHTPIQHSSFDDIIRVDRETRAFCRMHLAEAQS